MTMNTALNPLWSNTNASSGSLAGDLQQLVNIAGPVASGIAVALTVIQSSKVAEQAGKAAALDGDQRLALLGLCAVSAQMLSDAAMDACNALIDHESNQQA